MVEIKFNNYKKIIKEIQEIKKRCNRHENEKVTLVCVSKGRPSSVLLPLYDAGCRQFGENRVQEALIKIDEMPKEIEWHFIGHLQLNKVKKIMGKFSLIHSVDSVELAQQISRYSKELGMTTHILLQANTSGEETKQGLSGKAWKENIETVISLPNLSVDGLMTIAPLTSDTQITRDCFKKLRELKEQLAENVGSGFIHLSMGMSHDYPIAIEEGATLVRIGTAIFEGG